MLWPDTLSLFLLFVTRVGEKRKVYEMNLSLSCLVTNIKKKGDGGIAVDAGTSD